VELSIIIPCFNEEYTVGHLLESLTIQRWNKPWEVIVSDNGSTDGTLSVLERYITKLPNLRIVDSSDRKGAAHARNVGALAAIGKALAFCDADDEVAPGWLSAIGDALSEHDFVASRMDEKKLNRPLILKARGGIQQDGLQKYTYPPYLPHSGGCGLGVKKILHERVGGFDETMRQLEDTDYCWRIQLSGTPLYYMPDALVHIRFPETLSGVYRQAYVWAEYNVLLYKKYRPLGMPKLTVKTGVKAWVNLLRNCSQLCHQEIRYRWMWQFCWRLGRLIGCLKYRVLAI
jgi:glycosyltransferase involved in cell wall biosynthesis